MLIATASRICLGHHCYRYVQGHMKLGKKVAEWLLPQSSQPLSSPGTSDCCYTHLDCQQLLSWLLLMHLSVCFTCSVRCNLRCIQQCAFEARCQHHNRSVADQPDSADRCRVVPLKAHAWQLHIQYA